MDVDYTIFVDEGRILNVVCCKLFACVCGCLSFVLAVQHENPLFTEVFREVELKVKCMKLLVEVQSTMTSNYIDAAVYLCYIE